MQRLLLDIWGLYCAFYWIYRGFTALAIGYMGAMLSLLLDKWGYAALAIGYMGLC